MGIETETPSDPAQGDAFGAGPRANHERAISRGYASCRPTVPRAQPQWTRVFVQSVQYSWDVKVARLNGLILQRYAEETEKGAASCPCLLAVQAVLH